MNECIRHIPCCDCGRLQQSLQEQNRRFSPDSEWVAKNQALRDDLPEHYDADDIRKRMAEVREREREILYTRHYV